MGNRVLVGVLAAIDALVAAGAGLAAVLAPLTVLWVFGFGDEAVWGALWPAAARAWELGHLVPVAVSLPAEYVVAAGVPAGAADFTVSLAPLALAVFTAFFAARSGSRAAAAGAAVTGVVTGAVVFAAVATAVALTAAGPVAAVALWQAIVLPAVVFAVPAVLGALVTLWRTGDDGPLDRLRERLDPEWESVPDAVARGTAMVLAGLVAASALLVAVLVVVRGGEIVALFQAGNADGLGATVLTLAQLAYLPTLVVWAGSFVVGPGFALGAGTTVSPAVVEAPALPAIPVLGAVPPTGSPWFLLLGLVPVALAVLAGVRVRRDLGEAFLPRVVTAGAIAAATALTAGTVAACAAGALGPGTLATIGPDALAIGATVALEVLVGAAIALLAPAGTAPDEPPAEVADDELAALLARRPVGAAPLG